MLQEREWEDNLKRRMLFKKKIQLNLSQPTVLLKDFSCSSKNNICAWITQFLTCGKCTEKLSIFVSRPTTNKTNVSKEVHILHTSVLSSFKAPKSILFRYRDRETFWRANNAGVHFFLARVKCVPNVTLFCCKSELYCNFVLFGVIIKGFYLVNF